MNDDDVGSRAGPAGARRNPSFCQPLPEPRKLGRDFYRRPAVDCATDFLGKVLVHDTPAGRLAGVITDVEAYPAFVDHVHHGNKRTPRTRIMWGPGGHAYIYRIYGIWHQLAAVVNQEEIPDVVFIRGAVPIAGIDLMKVQWDKPRATRDLSDTPGKLCRSFGITTDIYGIDLTASTLYLEDWQLTIPAEHIRTAPRVGISTRHLGHDAPLRYYLKSADIGRLNILPATPQ